MQSGTARKGAIPMAVGMALAMGFATKPAEAQTVTIYGSLGNFDVVNNTGHEACGFEVEIEGLAVTDIGGGFEAQRYGRPAIETTPTGVKLVWKSSIKPDGSCAAHTGPNPGTSFFGGTCYMWNPATYDTAGCEHFGVWSYKPTNGRVISRWLALDPATPGTLVAVNPPVAVAQPDYYYVPPVRAGDPAQVAEEVEAPEPAEAPELYGDAQWMRVYVVQTPREVTLDELLADNTIVPQDLTQLESDWQIVQDEPVAGGNGRRKRHRNQGNVDPTTRSIIRRIEMHEFTGQYDAVTHEALCADLLCNAPAPEELGNMISAQMTAALVQPDALIVTRAGNGNIDSADKRIACGNKCAAPYSAGDSVTLTAKAGSGSQFAGWTGACSTNATASCTLIINGRLDAGANFTLLPSGGGGGGGGGGSGTTNLTLSAKVSGKGAVTGGGINCGRVCSTTVARGTVVTLSAAPEAGFVFGNWTGACTGTATSCTVTVNASATAQANFVKQ